MYNTKNVSNEVNGNPQSKQSTSGFILIIVFLLVTSLIAASCFNSSNKTTKEETKKPTKQDALIQSHLFIEQHLKSPGSADFPYQPDETIDQLNDSTFIVLSYVDSQNSFGALLRTHYKCKIIFSPDGTARYEDLIME